MLHILWRVQQFLNYPFEIIFEKVPSEMRGCGGRGGAES